AFTALGLLIVFILLIRSFEHLRNQGGVENESELVELEAEIIASESSDATPGNDAEMVAAIAAALALSARASESDQADIADTSQAPATGQGWRGQGRLEAFNARRLGQRGR
ncbi:MAG: hypothetical protein ACE5Q6_14400, partial [Dehalococcoidia bacterium]